MRTKIFWEISNYCTAQCSYCPSKYWEGEKPRSVTDYLRVTQQIIDHYNSLGRAIDWTFSGGEPLEMFDFPSVLKLCKEHNGTIDLTTNGGKLWLDWWAVEPNIDSLHLSYHYWQNPNLIKFIIQTFTSKNKPFEVTVPIRKTQFDEDMDRADELEQATGIRVIRDPLFTMFDRNMGMIDYTVPQLTRLFGEEWVKQYVTDKPVPTFAEAHATLIQQSPVFTGRLCNVGIEKLNISATGWVNGSNCNTAHLGSIWGGLELPTGPQPCKMQACTSHEDQLITKF
jgi:organic radical activating enzyme